MTIFDLYISIRWNFTSLPLVYQTLLSAVKIEQTHHTDELDNQEEAQKQCQNWKTSHSEIFT